MSAPHERSPAVAAACYVWYRVAADTDDARAAIAALFADVERHTGVAGRLLARADDRTTWMEVYEGVGDGDAFAATLARCAVTHDVATATGASMRNVERFVPLPARRDD